MRMITIDLLIALLNFWHRLRVSQHSTAIWCI